MLEEKTENHCLKTKHIAIAATALTPVSQQVNSQHSYEIHWMGAK